jgi:ribonucleoside-diphosphate reductase alpha chain
MIQYKRALEWAHEWQDMMGMSLSLGATAIAPNGTIGIVAESTPSADPLMAAAELRQVKVAGHKGDSYVEHVVLDPTAARLMAEGIDPDLIEDAYTIEPERRMAQQHYLQQYVDHSISSTCNLPAVVTDPVEVDAFGKTMMKYLPGLRGITCYPNGARSGQPRTPVDLTWALNQSNVQLESDENTCAGGVCAI